MYTVLEVKILKRKKQNNQQNNPQYLQTDETY